MNRHSKKVLYVYQGYYPWEVRIEKFCNSLQQAGYETTVLCRWSGEECQSEDYNGTQIIRVGFEKQLWRSVPTSFNPLWRRAIRETIMSIKPDLIIAREMLLAEACASAASGRIPVVMDMAEHYPAAMRSWQKYRDTFWGRVLVHQLKIPDLVGKWAVRKCDGIITVCAENLQRVHEQFDFPVQKLCIVHNTPPLNSFEEVRRGSSIPPRVFSYQGWITKERGVENLVRAFALAAEVDKDIELHIAGSGETLASVQNLRENSQVKSRIRLLGTFEHAQLTSINSDADIGVIPFENDEFRNHTIPNKLFDFMMCAKPLIVSKCLPLARIVHEFDCGIVVDCNDIDELSNAIVSMKDRDLKTMGMNGLKAAQEIYHWERDSQILTEFIATLV